MRTGLVLGAGGVVGAAWLMGALEALVDETGWDPSTAERIVGTSAGSVVGALVADGIPPAYLTGYAAGRSLDELVDAEERGGARAKAGAAKADAIASGGAPDALMTDRRLDALAKQISGDELRLHFGLPQIGPGSLRMAVATLRRPWAHAPTALMAGWLPRGFISTKPISELVGGFVEADWPRHPSFWAIAADYSTGKRVAFGRDDAPPAHVGDAVAASCAIPGFYHPPKIGGRRYVDGGICSLSNLDLLRGEQLDLVICLSPSSSLEAVAGWSPAERIGGLMRAASGRRLQHEARKLRDAGTEVLLVEPCPDDVSVMGLNFMARGRRVEVMEQARRSVALQLRQLRGTTLLPPRTRVKRGPARAGRSAPARATRVRAAGRRAA